MALDTRIWTKEIILEFVVGKRLFLLCFSGWCNVATIFWHLHLIGLLLLKRIMVLVILSLPFSRSIDLSILFCSSCICLGK